MSRANAFIVGTSLRVFYDGLTKDWLTFFIIIFFFFTFISVTFLSSHFHAYSSLLSKPGINHHDGKQLEEEGVYLVCML